MDWSSDDEDIINFIEYLGRPRKQRRVQTRRNHFTFWSDFEFFQRFHLSKACVTNILVHIESEIQSVTTWNQALSPMDMLLLTLRYFASGSMLVVVGDFIGIHKSTASRVIFKVTQAIAKLRPQYIKFPTTQSEKSAIQREFYNIAKFPDVVGAVDCTHVKIKSPGGDNAEIFRNGKGFFSFHVQTICDANLKIMDIVARWPGSANDSTIFNNSVIKQKFENGEITNALLLGDSAYLLKEYLITPFNIVSTAGENLFNEAQIRTHNPTERMYGVWKRRFPILSNGIAVDISKVQWIIVATAVLHNIAIMNNEDDPPPLDSEAEHAFNLAISITSDNANNESNNTIRDKYVRYFENL